MNNSVPMEQKEVTLTASKKVVGFVQDEELGGGVELFVVDGVGELCFLQEAKPRTIAIITVICFMSYFFSGSE
jgi:hypothetical protein